MGLDVSHDCWQGAYSSFHQFRDRIAKVAGIALDEMRGFSLSRGGISWDSLQPDALHTLLNHSDCDGYIEAADCAPLADRLEEILPLLAEETDKDDREAAWYVQKARQFIDGLRLAAAAGERVEFY